METGPHSLPPPPPPIQTNNFIHIQLIATRSPAMASTGEKVWGLHRFHAENADEVSFDVGETILVVEKDDAYGDGWWQVSTRACSSTHLDSL